MAKMTSSESKSINDLMPRIDELDWEKSEYAFTNFIEYFEFPHLVKVGQKWYSEFASGQYLFLHSAFDRYAITATPINSTNNNTFIISDWIESDCQILTKNPSMKRRRWVFQAAFELYRFKLPRKIMVLDPSPAHMRKAESDSNQWQKIVLKKNVKLTAVRRCQYKAKRIDPKGEIILSDNKEGFVLQDKNGNEYMVPPAGPLRFSTKITDSELHEGYANHSGSFSIPEILMRYNLPIDIKLSNPVKSGDQSYSSFRLQKFCVIKSVLAVICGSSGGAEAVELSPLLQFTVHLDRGLMQLMPPASKDSEPPTIDESLTARYRQLCNDVMHATNDAVVRLKTLPRKATKEEVEGIESAFDISLKMENDQIKQANSGDVYTKPEEAASLIVENELIPFTTMQPKCFTVHACVDQNNPYNEAIDYELDAVNNGNSEDKNPKLKEAFVSQADITHSVSKEQFAAAVQAIPDILIVEN